MKCKADHPDPCEPIEQKAEKTLADLSPERRASLLENAVSAALKLYEGEELYTMLHDSFGLTIQEIQDLGYLSKETMAGICQVPQPVPDGTMRVRDLLRLEGISEEAILTIRDSDVSVPLEGLKTLSASGQEDFAALLDAQVTDVSIDFNVPELRLDGEKMEELSRFCDALEAHDQAEQAMGPVIW